MRTLLASSALTLLLPLAARADDPTSAYETRTVEGWTLLVHESFPAQEPELLDRVLAEVRRQLVAIVDAVPAPAVDKLRQIQIWIELDDPRFPCMCYHVHEGWLREHGVNVEKTGHVELANPRNFVLWTKHQPWMVLHELAHGYHDRFLPDGYENATIAAALAEAKAAGRYGRVNDVNGRERDHYGATNPMEYFAEGTEAWFGRNDFFPFERTELEQYDPRLCRVLEALWGAGQSPVEAPRPAPSALNLR
jgi:hypothetical protein